MKSSRVLSLRFHSWFLLSFSYLCTIISLEWIAKRRRKVSNLYENRSFFFFVFFWVTIIHFSKKLRSLWIFNSSPFAKIDIKLIQIYSTFLCNLKVSIQIMKIRKSKDNLMIRWIFRKIMITRFHLNY